MRSSSREKHVEVGLQMETLLSARSSHSNNRGDFKRFESDQLLIWFDRLKGSFYGLKLERKKFYFIVFL